MLTFSKTLLPMKRSAVLLRAVRLVIGLLSRAARLPICRSDVRASCFRDPGHSDLPAYGKGPRGLRGLDSLRTLPGAWVFKILRYGWKERNDMVGVTSKRLQSRNDMGMGICLQGQGLPIGGSSREKSCRFDLNH